MKILTADEMRAADRVTTERFGISSLELMEHAGRAVTRFILRELPHCRHVVVLCGKGNNGGDGLVAARHLAEAGCTISVLILGDPAEIHGDAKTMLERLPVAPISIKEESDFSASGCKALLRGCATLRGRSAGHRLSSTDARVGRCRPQSPGGLSQDTGGRGRSPLRLGCRLAPVLRKSKPIVRMRSSPLPRPSWPTSRAC